MRDNSSQNGARSNLPRRRMLQIGGAGIAGLLSSSGFAAAQTTTSDDSDGAVLDCEDQFLLSIGGPSVVYEEPSTNEERLLSGFHAISNHTSWVNATNLFGTDMVLLPRSEPAMTSGDGSSVREFELPLHLTTLFNKAIDGSIDVTINVGSNDYKTKYHQIVGTDTKTIQLTGTPQGVQSNYFNISYTKSDEFVDNLGNLGIPLTVTYEIDFSNADNYSATDYNTVLKDELIKDENTIQNKLKVAVPQFQGSERVDQLVELASRGAGMATTAASAMSGGAQIIKSADTDAAITFIGFTADQANAVFNAVGDVSADQTQDPNPIVSVGLSTLGYAVKVSKPIAETIDTVFNPASTAVELAGEKINEEADEKIDEQGKFFGAFDEWCTITYGSSTVTAYRNDTLVGLNTNKNNLQEGSEPLTLTDGTNVISFNCTADPNTSEDTDETTNSDTPTDTDTDSTPDDETNPTTETYTFDSDLSAVESTTDDLTHDTTPSRGGAAKIAAEGVWHSGAYTQDTGSIPVSPTGDQLTRIQFTWREQQSSYGGGIAVRNANGELEIFAGTDNPQQIVVNELNGNALTQVDDGDGYDMWVETELVFDWSAGTVTTTFSDAETGSEYGSETVPLNHGENVAEIEFHGFSSKHLQRSPPELKTRSSVMSFSSLSFTRSGSNTGTDTPTDEDTSTDTDTDNSTTTATTYTFDSDLSAVDSTTTDLTHTQTPRGGAAKIAAEGVWHSGAYTKDAGTITINATGDQLTRIQFTWREQQSSYGGGIAVRNADGELEVFAGTDNPQQIVVNELNGDALTQVDDGNGYDMWIETELVFDWSAGTVTTTFSDAETGSEYGSETVPLNHGENVAEIEFHGFSSKHLQRAPPELKTRSSVMTFSNVTVTQ